MDHPEVEILEQGETVSIHMDHIVPIYPLTEGLPQRWLRLLLWKVVGDYAGFIKEPHPEIGAFIEQGLSDATQSSSCGSEHGCPQCNGTQVPNPGENRAISRAVPPLPSREQAIRWMHFPTEMIQADLARKRLALDEFIELQLQIQTRRKTMQTRAKSQHCSGDNRLQKPFLAQLGFRLTESQTGVLREIRHDMSGPHPMRRLLQGDVGSGKTLVAACTALMCLESGFDVVLMAPTEILAEQHGANFRKWFNPLGIKVELITGTVKTMNAESSHESSPRMVIGTHALLESWFSLPRLGLVIIDEQHKFGVVQRETLLKKGNYPHLLVMTATPIPRTLGLTLYGDLDSSVMLGMPPGRGRIRTYVRKPVHLPKVIEFIKKQLAEGRQACVVYPRVEETDLKTGMKAVKGEFEKLAPLFQPFKTGLLHGRLGGEEKESVMNEFRLNHIQVLVATSVIEVGVDVPNATVMLIENADQFGLAQLHQLRGRIGRGAHESYCILIADRDTEEAKQRLKVMEETNNGFRIAEEDLKLRGPGEMLGSDQSGAPSFLFGRLEEDLALIEWSRSLAAKLVS